MQSGVQPEQGSVSVEPRAGQRWRLAWYGVTVFVSSACLLVLEIAAGRLLAPYVGVSLYTWTSIIGVILAGLSLGNWLGAAGQTGVPGKGQRPRRCSWRGSRASRCCGC